MTATTFDQPTKPNLSGPDASAEVKQLSGDATKNGANVSADISTAMQQKAQSDPSGYPQWSNSLFRGAKDDPNLQRYLPQIDLIDRSIHNSILNDNAYQQGDTTVQGVRGVDAQTNAGNTTVKDGSVTTVTGADGKITTTDGASRATLATSADGTTISQNDGNGNASYTDAQGKSTSFAGVSKDSDVTLVSGNGNGDCAGQSLQYKNNAGNQVNVTINQDGGAGQEITNINGTQVYRDKAGDTPNKIVSKDGTIERHDDGKWWLKTGDHSYNSIGGVIRVDKDGKVQYNGTGIKSGAHYNLGNNSGSLENSSWSPHLISDANSVVRVDSNASPVGFVPAPPAPRKPSSAIK